MPVNIADNPFARRINNIYTNERFTGNYISYNALNRTLPIKVKGISFQPLLPGSVPIFPKISTTVPVIFSRVNASLPLKYMAVGYSPLQCRSPLSYNVSLMGNDQYPPPETQTESVCPFVTTTTPFDWIVPESSTSSEGTGLPFEPGFRLNNA